MFNYSFKLHICQPENEQPSLGLKAGAPQVHTQCVKSRSGQEIAQVSFRGSPPAQNKLPTAKSGLVFLEYYFSPNLINSCSIKKVSRSICILQSLIESLHLVIFLPPPFSPPHPLSLRQPIFGGITAAPFLLLYFTFHWKSARIKNYQGNWLTPFELTFLRPPG